MNKEQVLALRLGDKVRFRDWDNWREDPKKDGFGQVVNVTFADKGSDVIPLSISIQWEGGNFVYYKLTDEAFWKVVEIMSPEEYTNVLRSPAEIAVNPPVLPAFPDEEKPPVEATTIIVPDLPNEIDVDGVMDDNGIVYLGKAKKQPDGTWRCLAEVNGALCVVEVKIAPLEGTQV